MNILNFILSNWDSILIVLIAMITIIIRYKKGEKTILNEILFKLVTKAEQEFGTGTGELKKAAVLEWIYDKVPALMKMLLTKKELENMIEKALEYAKGKWEKNSKLREFVNKDN